MYCHSNQTLTASHIRKNIDAFKGYQGVMITFDMEHLTIEN